MHDINTILWTTMIGGYAQNGFLEKVVETFKQIKIQFHGL